MKQFHNIEILDTDKLYALELASSISVLFLAFGLIASMVNVLTKGSVLTEVSPLLRSSKKILDETMPGGEDRWRTSPTSMEW
jgi:hypothetical protein